MVLGILIGLSIISVLICLLKHRKLCCFSCGRVYVYGDFNKLRRLNGTISFIADNGIIRAWSIDNGVQTYVVLSCKGSLKGSCDKIDFTNKCAIFSTSMKGYSPYIESMEFPVKPDEIERVKIPRIHFPKTAYLHKGRIFFNEKFSISIGLDDYEGKFNSSALSQLDCYRYFDVGVCNKGSKKFLIVLDDCILYTMLLDQSDFTADVPDEYDDLKFLFYKEKDIDYSNIHIVANGDFVYINSKNFGPCKFKFECTIPYGFSHLLSGDAFYSEKYGHIVLDNFCWSIDD